MRVIRLKVQIETSFAKIIVEAHAALEPVSPNRFAFTRVACYVKNLQTLTLVVLVDNVFRCCVVEFVKGFLS